MARTVQQILSSPSNNFYWLFSDQSLWQQDYLGPDGAARWTLVQNSLPQTSGGTHPRTIEFITVSDQPNGNGNDLIYAVANDGTVWRMTAVYPYSWTQVATTP
jgi:hypothetical protein